MTILPTSPNTPPHIRGFLAFQDFPATAYSAPASYTTYGRTRQEAIAALFKAIAKPFN